MPSENTKQPSYAGDRALLFHHLMMSSPAGDRRALSGRKPVQSATQLPSASRRNGLVPKASVQGDQKVAHIECAATDRECDVWRPQRNSVSS